MTLQRQRLRLHVSKLIFQNKVTLWETGKVLPKVIQMKPDLHQSIKQTLRADNSKAWRCHYKRETTQEDKGSFSTMPPTRQLPYNPPSPTTALNIHTGWARCKLDTTMESRCKHLSLLRNIFQWKPLWGNFGVMPGYAEHNTSYSCCFTWSCTVYWGSEWCSETATCRETMFWQTNRFRYEFKLDVSSTMIRAGKCLELPKVCCNRIFYPFWNSNAEEAQHFKNTRVKQEER